MQQPTERSVEERGLPPERRRLRSTEEKPAEGFTMVANEFICDPSVPPDVRMLVMVFTAQARGKAAVRLSQANIREILGWPPERQDDAIEWAEQHSLLKVRRRKGETPSYEMPEGLVYRWVRDPDAAPASVTRKARAPVGAARRAKEQRNERESATPLLDGVSASSGRSEFVHSPLLAEGSTQRVSIDDECERLRELGIVVYPNDVGSDYTTGKRLTVEDLRAWAMQLDKLIARGLKNPYGFIAKQIREGKRWTPPQSRHLQVAVSKDTDDAIDRVAAENEALKAKRLEAFRSLPVSERREYMQQALQVEGLWLCRDGSAEAFAGVWESYAARLADGESLKLKQTLSYESARNAETISRYFEEAT